MCPPKRPAWKRPLAVGLWILTVTIGLGGMWWWALAGLREEVGMALVATFLTCGTGASLLTIDWE
jgi:hypothetical protein